MVFSDSFLLYKRQLSIISKFPPVRSPGPSSLEPVLRSSTHKAVIKVSTSLHHRGSTGDESASKLIWVVGKIHFLAVGGLRSWLFLLSVGSRLPAVPCHVALFVGSSQHGCLLKEWLLIREKAIKLFVIFPSCGSALDFYRCVTNFHEPSGLKTPTSVGQKSGHGMTGSCAQSITRLKSRCRQDWVLFWRLWRKNLHPSSVVVGRTHFLVVVGLRSTFSGYQSDRATHRS